MPSRVLDLTGYGYNALANDQQQVPAWSIDLTTTDKPTDAANVTIGYTHATVVVNASDDKQTSAKVNSNPNSNVFWPAAATAANLQHTVKRTINYLDADQSSHPAIAPATPQMATFNRTVVIDKVTGQVAGYVVAGQPVANEDQAWTSDRSNFASVALPTVSGYQIASAADQGAALPSLDAALQNVKGTAVAYDTFEADANSTNWSATVNVYYHEVSNPIGPDDNKQPNKPIDSSNPNGPQWPNEVTPSNLTATVQRTIQYLDRDANDQFIPGHPAITQTVHLTRTAKVNLATGAFEGYSDWSIISSDSDTSAKASPDLTALGYTAPSQDNVAEWQLDLTDRSQPTNPVPVRVQYGHRTTLVQGINNPQAGQLVDPTAPQGARLQAGALVNDLNKSVKRTVNFVAEDGHALTSPVDQKVAFMRNVVVDDVTGAIISYVAPTGMQTVNANVWATNDQFAAVAPADLTSQGYQTDHAAVAAATPNYLDPDQTINMVYTHRQVVIKEVVIRLPDNPLISMRRPQVRLGPGPPLLI